MHFEKKITRKLVFDSWAPAPLKTQKAFYNTMLAISFWELAAGAEFQTIFWQALQTTADDCDQTRYFLSHILCSTLSNLPQSTVSAISHWNLWNLSRAYLRAFLFSKYIFLKVFYPKKRELAQDALRQSVEKQKSLCMPLRGSCNPVFTIICVIFCVQNVKYLVNYPSSVFPLSLCKMALN